MSEASRKFAGSRINFEKLVLVYFMRSPDLEALGVMRSFGACGPGEICQEGCLNTFLITLSI